jgi:hypothetical protein
LNCCAWPIALFLPFFPSPMVNLPVCWLLFLSTYFPLFHSCWTLLGGFTSLVWFGIPSSLVIPAPTPSSCFGFGFGYGMLRLRPTYSKISQFFWIFWGIGEPPTKDRHRIQNPNRYWNGAYFGTSLVDHRYWIWYFNDLASLHTALTTIITLLSLRHSDLCCGFAAPMDGLSL